MNTYEVIRSDNLFVIVKRYADDVVVGGYDESISSNPVIEIAIAGGAVKAHASTTLNVDNPVPMLELYGMVYECVKKELNHV